MNIVVTDTKIDLPDNYELLIVPKDVCLFKTIALYSLELEKMIYKNSSFKKYDNIVFLLNNDNTNFLNCEKLSDDDIVFSYLGKYDYIIARLQYIAKFSVAVKNLYFKYTKELEGYNYTIDTAFRLNLKIYENVK